jgi:hypothetical protein
MVTKNRILQRFSITHNDFMLNEFTEDINDFQIDEIVFLLRDGYGSKDPGIRRTSTILNAIFTHRTLTFMVTRNQYNKILRRDPNHEKKDMSGSVYGLFIESLKTNGLINELRKPKPGKAGVYKIVDPDITRYIKKLHAKEVTEAFDEMMNFDKIQSDKEKRILDFYDSIEAKEKKTKQERISDIERIMLEAKGESNE